MTVGGEDEGRPFRNCIYGTFAAAANAEWNKTPGFGVVLTDGAGKQSWPVTGVSYILMHKEQADANKGKEVVKFFDWAFKNGAPAADIGATGAPPAGEVAYDV